MKAKGHWVRLVAKERKLGVNDEGVNDEGLGVKAVPRAAAVYDRQLKRQTPHFFNSTKLYKTQNQLTSFEVAKCMDLWT